MIGYAHAFRHALITILLGSTVGMTQMLATEKPDEFEQFLEEQLLDIKPEELKKIKEKEDLDKQKKKIVEEILKKQKLEEAKKKISKGFVEKMRKKRELKEQEYLKKQYEEIKKLEEELKNIEEAKAREEAGKKVIEEGNIKLQELFKREQEERQQILLRQAIASIKSALETYLGKFRSIKQYTSTILKTQTFLKEPLAQKKLHQYLNEIKDLLITRKRIDDKTLTFRNDISIKPYGKMEKKDFPGFMDENSNGTGWALGYTEAQDIEKQLTGRDGMVRFTANATNPTLVYLPYIEKVKGKKYETSHENLTIILNKKTENEKTTYSINKIRLILQIGDTCNRYIDIVSDNNVTSKKQGCYAKSTDIRSFYFNETTNTYENSTTRTRWENIKARVQHLWYRLWGYR